MPKPLAGSQQSFSWGSSPWRRFHAGRSICLCPGHMGLRPVDNYEFSKLTVAEGGAVNPASAMDDVCGVAYRSLLLVASERRRAGGMPNSSQRLVACAAVILCPA